MITKFLNRLINRFILLLFGLTFFSIIIGICKFYFPFVYDERLKDYTKFDELEIALFGDSHLQGGINIDIVSFKTGKASFQFAEGGNTLYESVLLARRAISHNKSLKIIIDLGTNNTPYIGTFNSLQGDKFNFPSYKTFISNTAYLMNVSELIEFLKYSPFSTAQSYLKGIFLDFSFINFEGTDFNSNTFIEKLEDSKIAWFNQKVDFESSKHHLPSNFEFDKLLELIDSYPGINFLIVRPPESQELRSIHDPVSIRLFAQNVSSRQNARFLDYQSLFDTKVPSEVFADLSHLNSTGMNLFTEVFITQNIDFLQQ